MIDGNVSQLSKENFSIKACPEVVIEKLDKKKILHIWTHGECDLQV